MAEYTRTHVGFVTWVAPGFAPPEGRFVVHCGLIALGCPFGAVFKPTLEEAKQVAREHCFLEKLAEPGEDPFGPRRRMPWEKGPAPDFLRGEHLDACVGPES